jgi:methionyl-tRNA formyltransferase
MRILFIGKEREDPYFEHAKNYMKQHFSEAEILLATAGSKFPEAYRNWKGDYLISYLCPWVIPAELIENQKYGAINFHPAPPDYPGSGCTNFAIYHEVKEYGVTCHYMAPKVDSGKIIEVRRFAVYPEDTVWSLTQRCYAYMLPLFFDTMTLIKAGEPLPQSNESWSRQAYRLKEFNDLKRITPEMDEKEIQRRIKATTYPGYDGAYMEIAGEKFFYKEKNK